MLWSRDTRSILPWMVYLITTTVVVITLMPGTVEAQYPYPDCQHLHGPKSHLDCAAECCGGNSTRRCRFMDSWGHCVDPLERREWSDILGEDCPGPYVMYTIYNHTLDTCVKRSCARFEDLPISGCSRDRMFYPSSDDMPPQREWCPENARRDYERRARKDILDQFFKYDQRYRECRARVGLPPDITITETFWNVLKLFTGRQPPCGQFPVGYGGSEPTTPNLRFKYDNYGRYVGYLIRGCL